MEYVETFICKNKSLYKCKVCEKKSEVSLEMFIYKYLWAVQAGSVFVFIISALLGGKFSLIGLFLILLMFSVFYVMTPYAVTLGKPEIKYVSYKNNVEGIKKKIANKIIKTEKDRKKEDKHEQDEYQEFTDVYSGKEIDIPKDIEIKDTEQEDSDRDISSN